MAIGIEKKKRKEDTAGPKKKRGNTEQRPKGTTARAATKSLIYYKVKPRDDPVIFNHWHRFLFDFPFFPSPFSSFRIPYMIARIGSRVRL